MATTNASTQKRTATDHPREQIANDLLTQEPLYLGTDGEGTAHFWDGYERTLALVETGRHTTLALAETPFDTLEAWCEYTRTERGWQDAPRVGGSLVGDLVVAVGRIE